MLYFLLEAAPVVVGPALEYGELERLSFALICYRRCTEEVALVLRNSVCVASQYGQLSSTNRTAIGCVDSIESISSRSLLNRGISWSVGVPLDEVGQRPGVKRANRLSIIVIRFSIFFIALIFNRGVDN